MNRQFWTIWLVFGVMVVAVLMIGAGFQYDFDHQQSLIDHNHITGVQNHLLLCRIAAASHTDMRGAGCP